MNPAFSKGYTLLELLIAIAIFALVLVTLISSIANLGAVQLKTKHRSFATQSAREGIEISYNQSVNDWESFKLLNGPYHPELNSGEYSLIPGQETLQNIYIREITISPVLRDANGLISDSGTPDPNSMVVVSKVTWTTNAYTDDIEFSTILINQNF